MEGKDITASLIDALGPDPVRGSDFGLTAELAPGGTKTVGRAEPEPFIKRSKIERKMGCKGTKGTRLDDLRGLYNLNDAVVPQNLLGEAL